MVIDRMSLSHYSLRHHTMVDTGGSRRPWQDQQLSAARTHLFTELYHK